MKNRLLKTFTSLVLTVLMVLSIMPAFAITIGAEGVQTYVKVTATPDDWSGKYLIVCEDGNVAFDGSLTTLDAASNKVSVNITDGQITGDFLANTFTIDANGNIKSQSGYYIGNNSNSNALSSNKSDPFTNTISFDREGNVVIKSSGGAYLRYNAASNQLRFRYYKSSTYTNQKAITLYKLVETAGGGSTEGSGTDTPETPACEHTNTTSVTEVPATCTTPGTEAGVKCLDCGEIVSGCEVIPAKGHKDDNTNGYCDVCNIAMCGGNHTWKETERRDATCTEDGYVKYECATCHETKIEPLTANGHTEVIDKAVAATCTETGLTEGKHCSVCDTVLVEQTETPIIGHNYVDGKCTMCDKAEPYTFKVGDVVIFTGSKADGTTYELTGFASGSTYGTATLYKDTPTGSFPLTVVKGYVDGTYAFKFGDSYITCIGEKNVNLSTTLDAKSSWTVKLKDDGSYDIKSCSDTDYYLQCNPSSTRFTTYKLTSKQQPIKVVKYTGPVIKSFSLSLNEGVTVKVTFDIPEAWFNANANAKVVFSNGEETVITEAGVNVYSVDLTPKQINDDLTVKIQLKDGSDYGATNNVSVSTYKDKVESAGAEKLGLSTDKYNALKSLLDAALVYSNAAGVKGDNLTNDFTGFDGVDYPTVVHTNEDAKLFTGFAGQLGTYASIYINVDTGKVPESGETLVLKIRKGENEKEIVNGDIANYITKDGQIVITGLFPANFDDIIFIESKTEGSAAEFTFNSYLKAIYNADSSNQSVKNLAVATYLYGLAAEAYLKAQ